MKRFTYKAALTFVLGVALGVGILWAVCSG
jgi:hypothetical protein